MINANSSLLTSEDGEKNLILTLFERVAAKALASKQVPGATYRVQFNKFFTFKDATRQVSYLRKLGITDLYASPYLRASTESLHGYDICDHSQLNPGIGSEEDYREFCAALNCEGLRQVLDIVPNHMGITEECNRWWMDVLENGPSSIYASYFDIDWKPVKDELEYKVLIPILGDQYGVVLERGELQIKFEVEEGSFYLDYWEHRQPINPRTYPVILNLALERLQEQLGLADEAVLELQSIITNLGYLPPRWESDYPKVMERNREKEILKRRLASLCAVSPVVDRAIEEAVRLLNGTPTNPESFDRLDKLIDEQAYRPAYWRVAADEINYRRFFDVNQLAAIRVENPRVFEESHRLIFKLIEAGQVTGLRVDHADGLWDPAGYLWNLQATYFLVLARQEAAQVLEHEPDEEEWAQLALPLLEQLERERKLNPASPLLKALYVVVEKILEPGESLPANWKVDGTSGYDFLNQVNGLFVDPNGAKPIEELYTRFIGTKWRYADLVYSRKVQISRSSLASEINVLARLLSRIAEQDRRFRDFTLNNLRFAIREVIACFPVYRTYIVTNSGQVEKTDQIYIERAIATARRRNPARDALVFDFIRELLLFRLAEHAPESHRELQYEFVMKFQQVTGPVMAKGLEDTTFYLYNRLISLNEVGGDPEQFGQSVETFHRQNAERLKSWPHALLTSSTHDTKRSEDVRARINVLSEIPHEWRATLNRWARFNERHRTTGLDGKALPDRNDEYLFYQTLIGIWPFSEPGEKEYLELVERVQAYMVKAIREAKFNTSWLNPNQEYEEAVHSFVAEALKPGRTNLFLKHFKEFQARTTHYGMFNSLSQLLLKMTSPGVPDFYQGTELWDLSLVDPDNRRTVDYNLRQRLLDELPDQAGAEEARQLVASKSNGLVKLYLMRQALQYRTANPGLFEKGLYLPLGSQGPLAENICAFARSLESKTVITVVPRLLARLRGGRLVDPLGAEIWEGNDLVINGEEGPGSYRNILTGEVISTISSESQIYRLPLATVLASFPVALLEKVES
ncbi:MAG TPA: malto-oligosyltrehalose synthase [Chloroflexia bacterium]|nr:malto-oligosyltrehalose synthase [Chloroflexia bacterium]